MWDGKPRVRLLDRLFLLPGELGGTAAWFCSPSHGDGDWGWGELLTSCRPGSTGGQDTDLLEAEKTTADTPGPGTVAVPS